MRQARYACTISSMLGSADSAHSTLVVDVRVVLIAVVEVLVVDVTGRVLRVFALSMSLIRRFEPIRSETALDSACKVAAVSVVRMAVDL